MSVSDYIRHLESAINDCPAITAYSLNIERRTEDIAFIYGTLEFRNGSALDFKEFVENKETLEKYKYAYNYRFSQELIFRFDNAPDPAAKTLPSFPHHKHQQDGRIVESEGISLSNVLSIIENIIMSSI